MLRESQQLLRKGIRELDREREKLQREEKKLQIEIKSMAKKGQMGAARIMAKDLVRTRRYVEKFYKMRAQLQAVSLRIQTLKSNAAMTDAMKGVAKAMHSMNQQLNIPAMQRIMMEFEKQSDMMDMKEEIMGDAIDDAMGDEDDEQESEDVVNQVLDEIGINLSNQMQTPAAPVPSAAPQPVAAQEDAMDKDLQARLDALRRS